MARTVRDRKTWGRSTDHFHGYEELSEPCTSWAEAFSVVYAYYRRGRADRFRVLGLRDARRREFEPIQPISADALAKKRGLVETQIPEARKFKLFVHDLPEQRSPDDQSARVCITIVWAKLTEDFRTLQDPRAAYIPEV